VGGWQDRLSQVMILLGALLLVAVVGILIAAGVVLFLNAL
jgi:hypothetical protein